ncbi:MAG: dihydroorotase [Methylophilaceae bacterium]|nr:dihydroorotase [Methylophilaceae bacterium]
MKIHIRNPRLIDPRNGIDTQCDLFIAAGRVVGIGNPPVAFHANQTIDADGLIACPGLVDISARLREPGFEYKATLESELKAAVAGGVTSLACPPDTDPVLDEPGLVEMLKYRAKQLNLAHVYPLGALTRRLEGKQLTEMNQLMEAGCVGFSQANAPLTDTQVLRHALQYAATFGLTVWLRPEDAWLARGGVAHDGEVAARLGLPGIPSSAETIALATILTLVEDTGARVHLCRLSTRDGVEMVRQAKARRLPVSCDVAAHQLHLTEHDIGYFETHCHLKPPLRTQRDKEALRTGVADGTVDAVCSDHTPVDDDAKLVPFAESEAGATGLEFLLSLTLKWAQESGIALPAALARVTSEPARLLQIDAGHLSVGAVADICLFDPEHYWKVDPQALLSQGKNTPFLGLELPGKVRWTLVAGQIAHRA